MAWIESHQALEKHPKVLRLSRAANWSIPETIGKLHIFWWWCLDYALDGTLDKFGNEVVANTFGVTADTDQFVAVLIESRLLDSEPCLRVHDWWDYAGRYIQTKYNDKPDLWMRIQASYLGTDEDVKRLKGITGDLRKWRHAVLTRDGFQCVVCRSKKPLHAHHIKPKMRHPKAMYATHNGVTLCRRCHERIKGKEHEHETYFINYLKSVKKQDVPQDTPQDASWGDPMVSHPNLTNLTGPNQTKPVLRTKRQTLEAFTLTDEMREWAMKKFQVEIPEEVFAEFKDHWLKEPEKKLRTDWTATFQMQIRKLVSWGTLKPTLKPAIVGPKAYQRLPEIDTTNVVECPPEVADVLTRLKGGMRMTA